MPLDEQTELVREAHARFPRARLVVTKGPDKGAQVLLEGQRVVVGSDESCELVLRDPSVSRRHLELCGGPGGYRVRDLRSTNGVVIDGVRVMDGRLTEKVTLQLGRSALRFEPERGEVDWPLSPSDFFGDAFGASVPMRRLFAVLERAAPTAAPVLLEAEDGCEVQALALALHKRSERGPGPFVAVDALSVESEAALAAKAVEAAHGTLFIADCAALPAAAQRRLAELADARDTEPDAPRIVASTTAPLDALERTAQLQPALRHALGVVVARVPALRERAEDLPGLVRRLAPQGGAALPDEVLALLLRHDWPGNLRELRSVVERFTTFPELGPAALEQVLGGAAKRRDGALLEAVLKLPYHDAKERLLERFERTYVVENLRAEGGNVTRAAQRMGLPRQTVHRLLRRLGLDGRDG